MEIVKEQGISKGGVYYIMKANNISRAIPTYKRYPNLKTDIQNELNAGLTGYAIAKKYNISKKTIYNNINQMTKQAQMCGWDNTQH